MGMESERSVFTNAQSLRPAKYNLFPLAKSFSSFWEPDHGRSAEFSVFLDGYWCNKSGWPEFLSTPTWRRYYVQTEVKAKIRQLLDLPATARAASYECEPFVECAEVKEFVKGNLKIDWAMYVFIFVNIYIC